MIVVERRSAVALETSYANAALIAPGLSAPSISPKNVGTLLRSLAGKPGQLGLDRASLTDLCRWSWRALPYLSSRTFHAGLQANLHLVRFNQRIMQRFTTEHPAVDFCASSNGVLSVFTRSRSFRNAVESDRVYRKAGLRHRVLDASEIPVFEPALQPVAHKLQGAIHHEPSSSGDAHLFCRALESECVKQNVEFRFDTRVKALERPGGDVKGVVTDTDCISADVTVVAAASESAALVNEAGVSLPLIPIKGYSLTLNLSETDAIPKHPVISPEDHVVFAALGNRLRVAGAVDFHGLNTVVGARRTEWLKRRVERFFPRIGHHLAKPPLNPWAGLRPVSCDGVPVIGKTRIRNLFINSGHGALGWSMAAGSGSLLADLVDDKPPSIDATPYSPQRFE